MAIQFMRGTSQQRMSSNSVLLPGQPFYETDTNKQYIGDGSTPLSSLKGVELGLRIENVLTGAEIDENGVQGQGSIRMHKDIDTNEVTGRYTTVLGSKNTVASDNSLVCGINNESTVEGKTSIGAYILGGENKVHGQLKYAIGQNLRLTNSAGSLRVATGIYNNDEASAMFMVGNGVSDADRYNALTILSTNNNVYIGNCTRFGNTAFVVGSDRESRKNDALFYVGKKADFNRGVCFCKATSEEIKNAKSNDSADALITRSYFSDNAPSTVIDTLFETYSSDIYVSSSNKINYVYNAPNYGYEFWIDDGTHYMITKVNPEGWEEGGYVSEIPISLGDLSVLGSVGINTVSATGLLYAEFDWDVELQTLKLNQDSVRIGLHYCRYNAGIKTGDGGKFSMYRTSTKMSEPAFDNKFDHAELSINEMNIYPTLFDTERHIMRVQSIVDKVTIYQTRLKI